MDLEGQWWKSQLAADIHQTLRRKELTLPKYKSASPQIKMRRYFADLLAVLSHRHKLCPTARHLAVFLLDFFMDHYDVALRQLYTVALSCLLLASKFEEKEGCVPKLEQLNCLGFMLSMKLCITKRDLVKTELLLLGTLDWNLCLPTPAHFIEYYLQSSVQEGDLHNGVPLTTLTKTKTFMDKYTHYFLEVSLQDHVYLGFQPSLVAASCITASRICLNISPSWTTFLHLLTGYTWDSLVHCIKLLLLAHDSDVKHADKMKKKSNSAANTHQFLRTSPVQLSSHSHILSPSLKHPSTEPNHQPQPLHTASYQPLSQRSSSPGLSFTGSDSGSSHTQHSFMTG